MTLSTLLTLIDMPAEPAQRILCLAPQLPERASAVADRLDAPADWAYVLHDLFDLLDPDPDGLRMLTTLLLCAAKRYPLWLDAAIAPSIYAATMRCFTRFTMECRAASGRWCFDRAFWVPRQLTMRLFRIGMLEYELTEEDGAPVVGLHIPSDACLDLPALRASWEAWCAFSAEHFSTYATAPIICESWLLSPSLPALLPSTSRILAFARQFRLTKVEPDATDYLEWVYRLPPEQRQAMPLDQLPEDTSLRRSMKQHLRSGGKVGIAYGLLKDDPFLVQ